MVGSSFLYRRYQLKHQRRTSFCSHLVVRFSLVSFFVFSYFFPHFWSYCEHLLFVLLLLWEYHSHNIRFLLLHDRWTWKTLYFMCSLSPFVIRLFCFTDHSEMCWWCAIILFSSFFLPLLILYEKETVKHIPDINCVHFEGNQLFIIYCTFK